MEQVMFELEMVALLPFAWAHAMMNAHHEFMETLLQDMRA